MSLPLHRAGYTKWSAFWYGQLSGMVEPVAGVLGAVFVSYVMSSESSLVIYGVI